MKSYLSHHPAPLRPGFGKPGSVGDLRCLPEAMRAEGLRLLIEIGEGMATIARQTGMSFAEIHYHLKADLPLIRGFIALKGEAE